jgi:hypothetical protein
MIEDFRHGMRLVRQCGLGHFAIFMFVAAIAVLAAIGALVVCP